MTKGFVMSKKSLLFFLVMLASFPTFSDRWHSHFANSPFYIEEIERDDGEISLEFSVPVNPESVIRENILVNGKPLPEESRIFFNRRGDEMEIQELPEWWSKTLCVEIRNLRSAVGQEMRRLPAFHLGPDDEVEWDEVYWCHHYQQEEQ